MPVRIRKLIGLVGIVAILVAWVWVATVLSVRVPNHWAAELVYYVVAGMGWCLPCMPLIAWMNRERA